MYWMVLLVLDDPERLQEILDAWEQAGVRGATIIESTGLYRVRRAFIPMRYAAALSAPEEGHLTLLAIVAGEAQARQGLQAAESVLGDLDGPDTGVFAAWPLGLVKGLPQQEV